MVDPRLDEQARSLALILERWQRLFEIYRKVLKDKAGTPQDSQEILQARIFLSQNYKPILGGIGVAVDKDDKVLEFLSRVHDVDSILALPDIERRRYESIWHESEVSLHTLAGEIEAQRRAIAAISPFEHHARRIWGIPAVRWVAGILFALVLLWVTGLLTDIKAAIRNLGKGAPAERESPDGRRAEKEAPK